MEKITALILAKNEERNIEDCIKTVQFCDEVLVIDDFSTDRTKEIAEGLGARVLQRSMNGDWGGQQTFAIQSAMHPWVLFVDADERISEALAEEIKETVARGEQNAYWIRRENRFHFNKATHGVLHPDYVNRLFPAKGSYKLNNYTTLAAKKYKKENKRCNFFLDIVLRPLWAFIKAYILELGFLDGRIGWILSVNHYFYTLNKYVKLYYLYKSDGKL